MRKINVTINELSFSAEEAMNRLRVNVRFSGANTKKIMVTSSVPNEGKSHVSVYLWKMLADAGYKTVLVDADLRKSVLKDDLSFQTDVKDLKGFDHYLAGMANYEDIVYETNVENAYFVPCVNLLENPSSLFEDARLPELLDRLGKEYDYAIIDTPPLVSVSDGALIGAACDGTILVVRCGEVPKKLVMQSVRQLERAGARLLGTVLNGVNVEHHAYGKYYGGYYGKYYGGNYGGYYGKSDTKKAGKKDDIDNKETKEKPEKSKS